MCIRDSPEKETRERLLPELFKCDLTEFIETCEIYSDSEEMNSLLVVSDEMCIRDSILGERTAEVETQYEQGIQELERISGLTSEQAKEYLLKSVEEDVKQMCIRDRYGR